MNITVTAPEWAFWLLLIWAGLSLLCSVIEITCHIIIHYINKDTKRLEAELAKKKARLL